MTEPLERGRHLAYGLSRQSSRGAQIGCTLVLAAILGGIGGTIVYLARRNVEPSWVVYVIGGGLALFGLLLLYAAVHQMFAMRTPQTIVEMDTAVLRRGARVAVHFHQAGPASFESLRANLVGEESWWTGSGKHRRHHHVHLGTFNVFDSGPFEVVDLPFERTVTVEIPQLPYPSNREHGVTWQLEVWGKVRGRADFQHVFPVQVAG
jgi:hypothetical protein